MDEKYTRNEIIRIFRKFARLGLANERLAPIQVYKKIETLCISRRSRLDMLAVYDTLRLLKLNGEEEILKAVFEVYFEGDSYRSTKQERGVNVLRLATKEHCDDRTIYRRLERARAFFERVRKVEGLIDDAI
ncbi:MAG: hypothetical protein J6S23_08905 [Clostridia bacterium]|nr:hypothetical protein [Clostridia bacterium]